MNVSSKPTSTVQSTQQPTRLQKTTQTNEQTQRSQDQAQTVQAQPQVRKPVLNTQGQTTGRLVNVTA